MRTYRKEIKVVLECKANNHAEATQNLNAVAHGIHSLGHPLTLGGKEHRTVSVSHKSKKITHIPKKLLKSTSK